MFTTQENFILDYNLIDIPEDGTFQDFIDKQEAVWLRKLLGTLLYDALVDGVESLPDVYNAATEYMIGDEVSYESKIWESLQNNVTDQTPEEGAFWTEVIDTDRTRWLKLVDGENYDYNDRTYHWRGMAELTTPLIYSLWINPTSPSSAGRTIANIENATVVSPAQDICRGWNAYHELACGESNFWLSQEDTLYGYLISVSANFAELDEDTLEEYLYKYFTNPKSKNMFGI